MGSDAPAVSTKTDEVLTSVLLFLIQFVVIVVCAVGDFKYSLELNAMSYGFFRDVSLMIFFGFGFLMTFLYNHGLSAVGYCLVISSVVVELSIVVEYMIMERTNIVTIDTLMNGLFCAGAVMISFGAVLGKVTPFQLLVMSVIEVFAFWLNVLWAVTENNAHDVGGGMTIHVFGAYFGLAATFWVTRQKSLNHKAETSIYSSDLFSLAGTIILWVLWPSFQAAAAGENPRQMLAASNTFLSLCSSTMAFAVVSRFLNGERFNVVHMQNATLAGGVVMGAAGDMDMGLHGAMIAGFIAGAISCLGYAKIQPCLTTKLRIHDTCGVNNLHGMPGILSAIVGIVVTAMHNGNPGEHGTKGFVGIDAAHQTYALMITLGGSLVFGTFAGLVMNYPLKMVRVFVPGEAQYSDELFFDAAPYMDEPEEKVSS